jgi:hypothetical protein
MDYDPDKVDEPVLALLYLTLHEGRDMMNDPICQNIEARLLQFLSIPHNTMELRRKGSSPELAAKLILENIRLGLSGIPKAEEVIGQRLFLRLVGPSNRVYAGE